MLFKNRHEAGQKLAERLNLLKGRKDVILLALPRGGVVVAVEVARQLKLPLDVVITRKIGAPYNREYGIGALSETGEIIWNEREKNAHRQAELDKIVAIEKKEAERRVGIYRNGHKLPYMEKKTVVVIDDGIATGYTMRVAVRTLKQKNAERIVVAVPHGSPDALDQLRIEGVEVISLYEPKIYGSVGQFYESFPQTTDEEVLELLQRFRPKTA